MLVFSFDEFDIELIDALKEIVEAVDGDRESVIPFESKPLSMSSSAKTD